jgi:hypothetical protein
LKIGKVYKHLTNITSKDEKTLAYYKPDYNKAGYSQADLKAGYSQADYTKLAITKLTIQNWLNQADDGLLGFPISTKYTNCTKSST